MSRNGSGGALVYAVLGVPLNDGSTFMVQYVICYLSRSELYRAHAHAACMYYNHTFVARMQNTTSIVRVSPLAEWDAPEASGAGSSMVCLHHNKWYGEYINVKAKTPCLFRKA